MTDRHPSLQTRDLVTAIQVLEGSIPQQRTGAVGRLATPHDSRHRLATSGHLRPRRRDLIERTSRSPGEGMNRNDIHTGKPIDRPRWLHRAMDAPEGARQTGLS